MSEEKASWWWPKPEPDPQEPPPEGVRARWTVMAGMSPGQADPAKTKTWDYTRAEHDADKALEPVPPSETVPPYYKLAAPHNNFTMKQTQALDYQLGLVNPPSGPNWIKAEFTWYPE